MSDKLKAADVLAKAVREYFSEEIGDKGLLLRKLAAYEAAPAKVREHLPYGSFQHALFSHMEREHGLIVLESEMDEIRRICRGIDNAYAESRVAVLEKALEGAKAVSAQNLIEAAYKEYPRDKNLLVQLSKLLANTGRNEIKNADCNPAKIAAQS